MAWVTFRDDTFTHADTSTGGAGTTTGVPTPASGQEWTDANGSVWQIVSNDCKGTPDGTPTTAYLRDFLQRPAGETALDSRIVADYPTGLADNSFAGVGLRQQAGGDYYLAHLDTRDSRTFIYKIVSGTPTNLANSGWLGAYDNTHTCQLSFAVTGTSPTTLSWVVSDTTLNTVANSGSVTDSEASLQNTGLQLLVVWVRSGGAAASIYTRVRTMLPIPDGDTLLQDPDGGSPYYMIDPFPVPY